MLYLESIFISVKCKSRLIYSPPNMFVYSEFIVNELIKYKVKVLGNVLKTSFQTLYKFSNVKNLLNCILESISI